MTGVQTCALPISRTNVGGSVCLNNLHAAFSWEASAPRIFRLVTKPSRLMAKSIELARLRLGSTLMVAMVSKVALGRWFDSKRA